MASKVQTRSTTEHCIFGSPCKMAQNILPSYEDIMKHFYLIKFDQDLSNAYLITNIFKQLIPEIKTIWQKASIPVVSDRRIEQIIMDYYDDYRTLQKDKGKPQAYEAKLRKFIKESKQLCDIACCKHLDYSTCHCEKNRKVPVEEREFLKDQRNSRDMRIGSLDLEKTKKNLKKLERQSLLLGSSPEHLPNVQASCRSSNVRDRSDSLAKNDTQKSSKQMRVNLESVALTCDRYGISNRCAASIVTDTLKSFNIVDEDDSSNVVDQSKIKRERAKARKSYQEIEIKNLKSLYFDGRKDKTLVNKKTENKFSKTDKSEEHIVLIHEPNSYLLGHLSPKESTADIITEELFKFFKDNDICTKNLNVLGCDGARVNTGIHKGICRQIEQRVGKPMHHFICLLHTNELLLHHLFEYLDGPTSGPRTHTGKIGKAIEFETCDNLGVVEFSRIHVSRYCTDIKSLNLSTDQELLYYMCKAVSLGNVDEDLARRLPGKVSKSRWLTTAIRILRIYISETEPSEELIILSEFVMKVYAKLWFSIKSQWSCIMGPRHLYEMIRSTRYLREDLRNIIDKVIQYNGFFAHQENILLSMLFDQNPTIRKLAHKRIKKVRNQKTAGFRKFEIPKINFEAGAYYDMIPDWNSVVRCQPPLLVDISIDEIKNQAEITGEEVTLPLEPIIAPYPCHTQAVERAIRLVTKASEHVCGPESRDGIIRTTIESIRRNPSFDNKGQYNVH